MDKTAEKPYQYWLINIPGINGRTRKKLTGYFGGAQALYKASEKELSGLLKLEQLEKLLAFRKSWDILGEYDKLIRQKIEFICYGETDYPKRLLEIPGPPYALYYQGTLPRDDIPSAAVIGARNCSEYGKYAAWEFGSKLAAAGIQIISGLAVGVDGISQRAALSVGGKSFGVLGCGVDICYPKSNRFLYETLKKQGGVLSEYAPGTEPRAGQFPPRNRIISGLSDLVLVVEAREKSGTLITVDMALEQGREVFAVPGRITDSLSGGCLRLLKQGAGIAASPEDILEAVYGIGRLENSTINIEETQKPKPAVSEKEEQILALLGPLSKTPEELYLELEGRFAIQEVMELLVELCLKGLALQRPEGGYARKTVLH